VNPFPDQGRPLATRLVTGFGRFWWDFLVGDTPEITAAVVVIVAVVAVLRGAAHSSAAGDVCLVALSVAALGASALRGRAAARRRRPDPDEASRDVG
jgi:hypothetical protein